MREKNRIKAKLSYLLIAFVIGWPCGFIAAAGGYYLTGMHAERTAMDFMLFTALAALVLSLFAGMPFMMLTEARIRDGIMPIDIYRREHNNFLCFMPQIAPVQLVVCAVMTAIRYLFIAAGVAVLIGYYDKEVDLLAGALLCGLLGGMAVVKMAHYMVMMKASRMDTEARLRSRRQTAEPETSSVKPAAEKAEAAKESAGQEGKKVVKPDLPAFEIPKVKKVTRTQEFKAPQPKRRAEKETPTEDFDLPKETRRYAPNAKTGVLPDMETMGLEFEDLDDM